MKKEWIIVANGDRVKFLMITNQHLNHILPSIHKDQVMDNFDKDARKPGHIRQAQGFLGNVNAPRDDLHDQEKKNFLR
jgi:hypothetical protein